ncbi:restriction endonuclease subunit S [Streptococcus sp. sy004]|uniref:restriction endonuclease subunit S n=1 Tax=Streptococcus sp. sy004 TaxID=2600149 RepID=UPI0021BD5AD3|nr:restriction endonuclease subunit S [Streptococcus sp. sy004]
MLDFTQINFDAQIKTSVEKQQVLHSKYPVEKLGDIVDVKIGGTPSRKNRAFYQGGDNPWVSISEMNGNNIVSTKEMITDEAVEKSNVKLIPKGTTLLSFKLSIGKTAIAGVDLYTNEAIAGLIPVDSRLLDKYIFIYFSSKLFDLENVGNKAFGKSLNSKFLKNNVLIPVPPIKVQEQLIAEVEKLDEQYENSRMKIEDYRRQIEEIFRELEIVGGGGDL